MCGIAGLVDLRGQAPIDPTRLRQMTDAMAHRGPDGEGQWHAPGVALGHRRLAVIDPAGGAQPMVAADGLVALVFNGMIYNFRALRAELAALGHGFRTDCDTEVLLHGWRAWGPALVHRLDGFFACAIWDARAQSLFLARDHWGKKPLYYALDDGMLCFGSDPLAVQRARGRPTTVNPTALVDYLTFGYVPDPKSLFAGVHTLPPAHYWLLRRGGSLGTPERWWLPRVDPTPTPDAAERLMPLLQAAVQKRLVADRPLGLFLSGGIDSGGLLALAKPTPLALTMGFAEPAYDERASAALSAAHIGAQHIAEEVRASSLANLDALTRVFSDPFADSSALPMLRLAQLAERHVTVALTGDGGDEVFAGYRRYPMHRREEMAKRLLPGFVQRHVLGPLARAWPQLDRLPRPLRFKATLTALAGDQMTGLARATCILPPDEVRSLLSPAMAQATSGYDPVDRLRDLAMLADTDDPLARAQFVDLLSWLPGRMLVKVDRAAMAHGIEPRSPLLDLDLTRVALRLSTRQKLAGMTGKVTLRQMLAPLLPAAVLNAPKRGFVPPIAQWMRGPWRADVTALPQSEPLLALIDRRRVQTMVDAHLSGARDHSRALWSLLLLARWPGHDQAKRGIHPHDMGPQGWELIHS